MCNLVIDFIPKDISKSDYDWVNISDGEDRVGKVRCSIDGDNFIIYSINIFPEFEGRGYGKHFVELSKKQYKTILAHNVRYSAIGFWERLGFIAQNNGHWLFNKSL